MLPVLFLMFVGLRHFVEHKNGLRGWLWWSRGCGLGQPNQQERIAIDKHAERNGRGLDREVLTDREEFPRKEK